VPVDEWINQLFSVYSSVYKTKTLSGNSGYRFYRCLEEEAKCANRSRNLRNIFMAEIQVIFFDVGGTLFEVNGSVGEIYSRFARSYCIDRDPDALTASFSRSFREQPPLAFPAGTTEVELHRLERDWWRRLVLDVVSDFPRFDEFFREVYEFFRRREAWVMFDDVIPTLTALKDLGMQLAIISNYDSRLDDLLRAFEIESYFDGVHISSRLGAAKPDREIFRAALRRHRVEPQRALHAGDSLKEDAEGASLAGMYGVLLDRTRSSGMNDGLIRISRLEELIGIVE
jgi:putative hydrolase of the HAD superfamily